MNYDYHSISVVRHRQGKPVLSVDGVITKKFGSSNGLCDIYFFQSRSSRLLRGGGVVDGATKKDRRFVKPCSTPLDARGKVVGGWKILLPTVKEDVRWAGVLARDRRLTL